MEARARSRCRQGCQGQREAHQRSGPEEGRLNAVKACGAIGTTKEHSPKGISRLTTEESGRETFNAYRIELRVSRLLLELRAT